MNFQTLYKKSISSILLITILSFGISFATPENAAADTAGSANTSAVQSATASCVAQSLGIDTSLTSLGSTLGLTTPSISSLTNPSSGNPTSVLPGKWGSAPGPIAIGNPPIDVVKISDSNAATYYQTTAPKDSANINQLANNSNGQKADKKCTDPLLQSLAKLAAMQLIQNITESTVNWINNGFKGPTGQSGPVFIADPAQFLSNTADQVVGDVLFNDPALKFLCAPFQSQVKIALGLSYSQPFYKQINCTLTGALKNIQNAGTSFSKGGGWSSWIQISAQPQNNAFGAFLMTKAEIDSQIAAKQLSETEQLRYGQGALSFMQCNKVTRSPDSIITKPDGTTVYNAGQVIKTESFTGSPSYVSSQSASATDGSGNTTSLENCAVKTPGATIVGMLNANTTSNTQVASLDAALSNGIDSVFNALLNQLESQLASRLKNGVLGDNSNANQNLAQGINSLAGQLQSGYTGASASVAPYSLNPLDNYDNNFGQGYGAGFNTTPAISQTNDQGINVNDPLFSSKTNALSILNSIWNFEAGYQNTYGTAINMLTNGRAVFENVISCDTKLGDSISYTRAVAINANVISNIDRTINYSRTVDQIPWSLPDIEKSVVLSNAHIATINAAKDVITNATTGQAISDEMEIINGTTFNADEPLANMVNNIGAWFTSMSTAYNTAECPINLTATLSGAPITNSSSTVTAGSPIYASSTTGM